jgi:hypothetical protein
MRSRLALTIVFLTSVPAFSQPFTLESTGGTINFGSAPLHIAISPNGEAQAAILPRRYPRQHFLARLPRR